LGRKKTGISPGTTVTRSNNAGNVSFVMIPHH
jgi:hypothetical protein